MRRAGLATALCVLVVIAAGYVSAGAAQAREAPLLRGICDPGLIESYRTRGPAVVNEFGTRLGADVVRINLRWSESEQRRGAYDEDYLGRALRAVSDVRAQGMRAVVLVYQAPGWASDRQLWDRPISGDRPGVYQSYYPPSLDSLDAFRAFAQHLAQKLQGQVLAYSCWVEPNLWTYLYPQRTSADPAFAAHRYARMLAAFSRGVRAGDPDALVVAGETSPTGDNTRYRTSPLRFARQLRDTGAAADFDVFAHHPYPVAGNRDISPAAIPRDPSQTVWLGNLGSLLAVYPSKAFYLSEFAYSTASGGVLGVAVDQVHQATYLSASYRIAARYPQVQLLTWFPRQDHSDSGTYSDRYGVFGGLRDLRGAPKRAYYAFAGGNQLTMSSSGALRRGATLTLRGRLTSERMGGLGGKDLAVMARHPGGSWVTVTSVRTRSDGSYVVGLRPQRSATWRVHWAGVVTSPADWVPVTLP